MNLFKSKIDADKAVIHNVIILDRSGSMDSIRQQAVGGVNETLQSIRVQQRENPEVTHLVTLVAFCGCNMQKIYRDTPIEKTRDLTPADYIPCCTTPLYDAIGTTITALHTQITGNPAKSASVTIITDGYENASREFDFNTISRLIAQYKQEGWLFAYIGADHDVEKVAINLHIDHSMRFNKTEDGTRDMFRRERQARKEWSDKMAQLMKDRDNLSHEELMQLKRRINTEYFDE